MTEIWITIKEYNEYQVSNWGRVKSLKYGKEKLIKPSKDTNGYLMVNLCKDGKGKMFLVHRLVAEAFLPNSYNLPQVNHKNEDKTDNRVENLEFCDSKYNLEYNDGQKRRAESLKGVLINRSDLSKTVNQYTKEGMLVAQYPSTMEAERQTGYSQGNISQCCRGERNSAYGFIWKYQ